MFSFFRALFGTDFMPHLYRLRNDPGVLWLHVLSDLAIALAYFAIPVLLFDVVRQRSDLQFRRIALLFVAFIAACGATHVLAVWTIWVPMYRLEGVAKAATAVFSVGTAAMLLQLRPILLKLPSIAELETEIDHRLRAEQAVEVTRGHLARVAESTQDYAVYSIDPAGLVRTWEAGAEHMKGYTSAEILGKSFTCFYGTEDISAGKPMQAMARAREMGRFETQGWRYRKDGTRFWANVILRPQYDGAGVLLGFTKVTHDLTESRENESKFEALLEAAPDAILIVDVQGKIDFVNSQTERVFGYARSELLGKPVDMLNPERVREEQAKFRERIFSDLKRVEANADAGLWGLRKDGSEFPIEFSLSPLETRDGQVFLIALRDVTERKKAETRFRALLESAPDAMVIVNAQGLIELANFQTERLFGYTRTELVGHPVDVLVPQPLRATHGMYREGYFEAPKRREMGVGLDLMALRKDGTQFPVEISLSPLEDSDGISVTAAIRDITERRAVALQLAEKVKELRHSNESLEQFAHIASHDLQEPLRMVASYTQLLSRRYKGRLDAEADEFIAYAVDGTQRMKHLIEDLLLYSRAGKGAPAMAEFHAEDALREALNNLHTAIEESGAEITSDTMPVLVAIRSQVVQILQNLIGNAIKYRGGRAPKIRVSAMRSGNDRSSQEWIFSVADNGIGIDSRYFDRIFQIFQRLHGREEYEGTGIGLAICKRILEQQGGRIWVESEPEKGSTFHFALPMR